MGTLVLAGAVLIAGWGLGHEQALRLRPHFPAMVPESALALLLLSLACICVHRGDIGPLIPLCALVCIALVAHAFWRPAPLPGMREGDAMSPATAAATLLIAAALLRRWWDMRRGRSRHLSLATAALAVTAVPVLGYLFDAEALLASPAFTQMSLHSALGLLGLCAAFLMAAPGSGWVGTLTAQTRGGLHARRLLPALLLVPPALAALALEATRWQWVEADLRAVLLALLMIVAGLASVLWFARLANRAERRARALEHSLRQSEAARRAGEHAAERAQRIEALGRLVGGVAHDFNNTLLVIMGNLEMLEVDEDPANRELYLREALAAANHASTLTRQLLAYGRKSRPEPRAVELDALVRETLAMFRRVTPATVRLRAELCSAPAMVELDASGFRQALLNVLINARDAVAGGGEVVVACEIRQPDPLEAKSGIAGAARRAHVVLTVRDSGPGMPEEVRARATEPFFTTKAAGDGTGLGLSMVLGFCRQSGGTLRIDTAPGRGTTVTMRFPRADTDTAPAPDMPAPALPPAASA